MRALAIIFTCLFFVSLVGLAVVLAATDMHIGDVIRNGDFRIGFYFGGDREDYRVSRTFEESYSSIEIKTTIARVNIKLSEDNVTRVEYKGGFSNITFDAEVRGDTLRITEDGRIRSSWTWGWNMQRSELDIELPDNIYNRVVISITSGSVNADMPVIEDLDVRVTSGSVTLRFNDDGYDARKLKSYVTSGTVNISGFQPDTYEIDLLSGVQNISGFTGHGTLNITSGTANLRFAEWSGNHKIDVTSGTARITLPQGSGAELTLRRTSGSLRYDLDGAEGRVNSSGTSIIGGSNRQKIDVRITSGSVSVTN
jgi:lia operon protein LiaG